MATVTPIITEAEFPLVDSPPPADEGAGADVSCDTPKGIPVLVWVGESVGVCVALAAISLGRVIDDVVESEAMAETTPYAEAKDPLWSCAASADKNTLAPAVTISWLTPGGRIKTAATIANGPAADLSVLADATLLNRMREAFPNNFAEIFPEANILLPMICNDVPAAPRTAVPLRGPSGHPFNVMLVTEMLLAETALIKDCTCVLVHAEAAMEFICWPKVCWLS